MHYNEAFEICSFIGNNNIFIGSGFILRKIGKAGMVLLVLLMICLLPACGQNANQNNGSTQSDASHPYPFLLSRWAEKNSPVWIELKADNTFYMGKQYSVNLTTG